MTKERRVYSSVFRSKVALDAIRGEATFSELAAKHGVSVKQIGRWKQQAIDGISDCFTENKQKKEASQEDQVKSLHAKIGELLVERDFLRPQSKRKLVCY
jgi:transposase